MSRLTLSYKNLYVKVSEFLGLGSSPAGDNLTKVESIVHRGIRQFLYPVDQRTGEIHVWSFVKQFHVINTVSGKYKYELPLNFSDFLDVPHFDGDIGYNELTKIGPEQIIELRAASVSTGFPTYFALAPFTYDNATGTMYEMWVDPVPDGVYLLKFFYRIDPLKPEATGDDNALLIGGVRGTEALLETCFAVAESQEDETIGLHNQLANDLVQKLIRTDIQDTTDFLGNLTQKRPPGYRWYSAVNAETVYETEGGV